MKILLFGGEGQLGHEIRKRAEAWNAVITAPLEQNLDICSLRAVQEITAEIGPDCIINAAAYTAVDRAESDVEKAFRVNEEGARCIATAARGSGARVLQVSTDYVFEGNGSSPLRETDSPNPQGVYGRSKFAGEKAVLENLPDRSLVVRTASLHGRFGGNFVHTMVQLFREKDRIQVVSDQFSSPTWAGWLAEILLELSVRRDVVGVLHAAGAGGVSWYEFACTIKDLTRGQLGAPLETRIDPVSLEEFPRPAPRPRYSVLDCSRLTSVLGRPPITWLNGLKSHLRDLDFAIEDEGDGK